MGTPSSREDRYARAEELLGDWLAARETGGSESFSALAERHGEIAAELQELGRELGVLDDAIAAGRAQVAAQRAEVQRMLSELGARSDFGSRYVVEAEVGRGGMGAVFRAQDKRLDRSLAMKVILGQADANRSGRAPAVSPHLLQRFLKEARITGRLEHPGIVPVHEVGVDAAGCAYFTMKLVKGRTLAEVLARSSSRGAEWSRSRVLQVIQRVCEALAYAHEQGVVHRDLKPQNVMVGDFGEVYVMDWGLARCVGEAPESGANDVASPDFAGLTHDGAIVGTPAYMPPEQAAGRLNEVGPHSDVYAIGAMLYEMIAGHPPYCGPEEDQEGSNLVRRIAHGPPVKLATRSAPPELVAICERAMAHEWCERYATVGALASELGAFLDGRVVRAYASGTWAELVKWVQRNRGLAAAAVVALVAIVGGSIGSLVSAQAASDRAEETAVIASFQQQQLSRIDVEGMGTRLRRRILDAAEPSLREAAEHSLDAVSFPDIARATLQDAVFHPALSAIDKGFANRPVVRASLLDAAANAMRELGLVDEALAPQREAFELRRTHLGEAARETLTSWNDLGGVHLMRGEFDEAERCFRAALEMCSRSYGADDVDTASLSLSLGVLLASKGAVGEAEKCMRNALRVYRLVHGQRHHETLGAINCLGGLCLECERYDEAWALLAEALEGFRETLGPTAVDTLVVLNNQANLLHQMGDLREALAVAREAAQGFRESRGLDDPMTLNAIDSEAVLCFDAGDLDRSELLHHEVLAARRRVLGSAHVDTIASLLGVARCQRERGQFEEAATAFRAAMATALRAHGEGDRTTLRAMHALAMTEHELGHDDVANDLLRRCIDLSTKALGGADEDTLLAQVDEATVARERGDLATAKSTYEIACRDARGGGPSLHRALAAALDGLGITLGLQGSVDAALASLREARSLRRHLHGDDDYRTLAVTVHEADVLIAAARPAQAVDELMPLESAARHAFAGARSEGLVAYLTTLAMARTRLFVADAFPAAETALTEAWSLSCGQGGTETVQARSVVRATAELYEAWARARPGAGYEAKAARWRANERRVRTTDTEGR
ncbi:MAG: serine/threonine-protein kinase [Planctomycetota bacterium]